MLNLSWWLSVILQLSYVFIITSDSAWSLFSMLEFVNLSSKASFDTGWCHLFEGRDHRSSR